MAPAVATDRANSLACVPRLGGKLAKSAGGRENENARKGSTGCHYAIYHRAPDQQASAVIKRETTCMLMKLADRQEMPVPSTFFARG